MTPAGRLLRSLGVGLAVSFVLVWVFDTLPEPWGTGALVVLLGVALGWLLREWLEVRRIQRDFERFVSGLSRDE